jgi:hypothetical protein
MFSPRQGDCEAEVWPLVLTVADSGGVGGTSLTDDKETMFLNNLFVSFMLYSAGMVLIFCVYWNLVMNIEEKLGTSDGESCSKSNATRRRTVSLTDCLFGLVQVMDTQKIPKG